jgi:hypothetical protein
MFLFDASKHPTRGSQHTLRVPKSPLQIVTAGTSNSTDIVVILSEMRQLGMKLLIEKQRGNQKPEAGDVRRHSSVRLPTVSRAPTARLYGTARCYSRGGQRRFTHRVREWTKIHQLLMDFQSSLK